MIHLHAVIVTERIEVASCLESLELDLKLDLIDFVAIAQVLLKAWSRETLLISQVFFNYTRTHESPTHNCTFLKTRLKATCTFASLLAEKPVGFPDVVQIRFVVVCTNPIKLIDTRRKSFRLTES